EITSNLENLTRSAALFLNNKGLFITVFPAERLLELTTSLQAVKLEPKHLKFIHPKNSDRATMLMLAARKNGAPGIIIEKPLII
ncbi:MAG: methyltransferase, partial [Deltaproteobacteria bacterium]|nr:methyltransferase [Deltaproteobacteria bacterium]